MILDVVIVILFIEVVLFFRRRNADREFKEFEREWLRRSLTRRNK